MAENIPPGDDLPSLPALPSDASDNPPEPDSSSSRGLARVAPVNPDLVADPFSAPPVPTQQVPAEPQGAPQLPDIPSSSSSVARAVPPPGPSPPPQPGPSSALARPADPAHPIDPDAIQVDPAILAALLDIGFDEFTAQLAIVRTVNAGVEQAVQWIVERSNDSDNEEVSSDEDEDEEEEEMGGVNSTSGEGGEAGVAAAAAAVLAAAKNRGRTHKMVFVVNMSLKMGTGKLAAQVGHATLGVYRQSSSTDVGRAALDAWRRYGEVKIVLKGQSTEQLMDMFKTARDSGVNAYLVQDAGYTQIPPGSRTVLGLFGPVENVDAIAGQLKLL